MSALALVACVGRIAGVVNLALLPIVLTLAITCVVVARQARQDSATARQATRNAAQLTTSIVMKAAPFLECQVCGATLDPRVGIGIGLDQRGQLNLRCAEHPEP